LRTRQDGTLSVLQDRKNDIVSKPFLRTIHVKRERLEPVQSVLRGNPNAFCPVEQEVTDAGIGKNGDAIAPESFVAHLPDTALGIYFRFPKKLDPGRVD
jgi:hypothetical protein